jgi:hypothetical protein
MKFWPSIVPGAEMPNFNPPLLYNPDGSNVGPNLVINKGKRRYIESSRPFKRSDQDPQLGSGHLIVSNMENHSAK